MPFAPQVDQDLGQPPCEDPSPVHPGMAGGAERHQLGVVARLAVVHIYIMLGPAAAAGPAVALEGRIPVASKKTRRKCSRRSE
jgi:hypothetical protein